jgi:putative ABC transport system permease protein
MKRFAYLASLAGKSAWNRRGTLALVVLCIVLSTLLLLGIERIRGQIRENFVQAVSGVDLVAGARGDSIQLMLYAVFHLGGATNNMGWESAQRIAAHRDVAWTIPLSMGDSHKGYPVVATVPDFFEHYRFRAGERVEFAQGRAFDALFDVVIGAEVARKLGYRLGSPLVLSHGDSETSLAEHGDKPFAVSGVLAPTGTPVDRALYISLAAMEAIHLDWRGGAPIPGFHVHANQAGKFDLTPKSITALLVGLKSRSRVFALQREIGAWKEEALMGVMPGVALDQLWRMLDTGERALLLISALVTLTGLAGLASAILAGLGERRRELAILRSAGARPLDILFLLACEGVILVSVGIVAGLVCLVLLLLGIGPALTSRYGVVLFFSWPGREEWLLLGGIAAAGFLTSLIPAWRAYRISLSDGLALST